MRGEERSEEKEVVLQAEEIKTELFALGTV